MPTSSVSGMLSTSAYFTAVFLLMVVVMAPVGEHVYRGASRTSALRLDQSNRRPDR